jgi:hypothetical protein
MYPHRTGKGRRRAVAAARRPLLVFLSVLGEFRGKPRAARHIRGSKPILLLTGWPNVLVRSQADVCGLALADVAGRACWRDGRR